jgi:hypothetical protein
MFKSVSGTLVDSPIVPEEDDLLLQSRPQRSSTRLLPKSATTQSEPEDSARFRSRVRKKIMTSELTGRARLISTWFLRVLLGFAFLGIGIKKLTGTMGTFPFFAAIGWDNGSATRQERWILPGCLPPITGYVENGAFGSVFG